MSAFMCTYLQGLQLQKFVYEIRTSGHNVPSLGATQQNICKFAQLYYASR